MRIVFVFVFVFMFEVKAFKESCGAFRPLRVPVLGTPGASSREEIPKSEIFHMPTGHCSPYFPSKW
jgi:hypothetical protein